jgi:hypothetical protein
MQSLPSAIPRVAAISGETFAPGQVPAQARLGALAELDLQRPHRADCTRSLSRDSSKRPWSSRTPKYACPIWKTRSPPLRW